MRYTRRRWLIKNNNNDWTLESRYCIGYGNGLWNQTYSLKERVTAVKSALRCSFGLANTAVMAANMIIADPESRQYDRRFLEAIVQKYVKKDMIIRRPSPSEMKEMAYQAREFGNRNNGTVDDIVAFLEALPVPQ
jgi:hypothetical protein